MRYLGSIVAWAISGSLFGFATALLATSVGCLPKYSFKSDLFPIWGLLLPIDYGVLGACLGAVAFPLFRRQFPNLQRFRGSLFMAILAATGILLVEATLMIWMPAGSCAAP
jgi:hypothetical protein